MSLSLGAPLVHAAPLLLPAFARRARTHPPHLQRLASLGCATQRGTAQRTIWHACLEPPPPHTPNGTHARTR